MLGVIFSRHSDQFLLCSEFFWYVMFLFFSNFSTLVYYNILPESINFTCRNLSTKSWKILNFSLFKNFRQKLCQSIKVTLARLNQVCCSLALFLFCFWNFRWFLLDIKILYVDFHQHFRNCEFLIKFQFPLSYSSTIFAVIFC